MSGSRRNEDPVQNLIGQFVVVHGREVADRRWVHQGHSNLEFVGGGDARHGRRKDVQSLSQTDQPSGPRQMVQGLTHVAL